MELVREREEKVKWLYCALSKVIFYFFFFFKKKSLIDGGVFVG